MHSQACRTLQGAWSGTATQAAHDICLFLWMRRLQDVLPLAVYMKAKSREFRFS